MQNVTPLALSSVEKSVIVQTNKQTNEQKLQKVNDISTPCLSACVDKKYEHTVSVITIIVLIICVTSVCVATSAIIQYALLQFHLSILHASEPCQNGVACLQTFHIC